MADGGGVRVEVLGPIRVLDDEGDEVSLSPQLRRLTGILVAADGGPVSVDRLAEHLTGGPSEGSTLRTAVSRLRKVVGDRLAGADGGYRLVLADDELDRRAFEQLVDDARACVDGERVDLLASAVEMWRGPAFGDLADEPWASATAAGLDEARASAVESLAEALVGERRFAEAVEILEAHVVEHPLRERPVGLLMGALAGSGRMAEALRTFQRFRTVLRDEAGLEPSAELRAIEASLLSADPETPQGDGAVQRSSASVLPEGTVTFLFTDIEGSTERWAADEGVMAAALADHDEVLRDVVGSRGGVVFKHTGDGVCAVFSSASSAVAAAVEAQGRLGLPVRMGVHTGEAELRGGDYFGPTLNRVARIMDAGHGGQVLMSSATAGLVADVDTVDLGTHRLKGLAAAERIVQVGDVSFPALRVATARRGNLPTELSAFVGRDAELDVVTSAALEHRLTTLFGVGGTGKTRLAIEAAHRVSPTFPDGCWLVQLAQVSVADAVPAALAAGLGVALPESGEVMEVIVRRLRHERRLIVVDNCEHVLDAAAAAVEELLESCPAVAVVATSREPLLVAGEHLRPIPSLSADDAVDLFLDRARAEAPTLVLDDGQVAAVRELCERLDRLPLAIELAASRMRSMSPSEALQRLDERFRLLVGGRRSRMERHQTMRATVQWSYELCEEVERRVFDRLSVFASAFDLDLAATVVAGDDLDRFDVDDAIARLVDRSLVQRQAGDGGVTRFRLLETMRAFGHEQLDTSGDSESIREAHAVEIDRTVCALGLRSLGPDEAAVHQELRGLAAEALQALDWSIDVEDVSRAYRIASSYYLAAPGTSLAMFRRLSDAILGSEVWHRLDRIQQNVLSTLVDGLRFGAGRADLMDEVEALMSELGSMPTDYWSMGPLLGGGRLDADFEQVAVDRWMASLRAHPPSIRFLETVFAAETSGELGRKPDADRYIDEAHDLAEILDSETARRRSAALELLRAEEEGSDPAALLDRVRSMLRDVIDPSGGDVLLACRLLRVSARHDPHVSSDDVRRPLRWVGVHTVELVGIAVRLSVAVALAASGRIDLAERLVATVEGEPERRHCAVLYDGKLPPLLVEQLRVEPSGDEPFDEVVADVLRYADELDSDRQSSGGREGRGRSATSLSRAAWPS